MHNNLASNKNYFEGGPYGKLADLTDRNRNSFNVINMFKNWKKWCLKNCRYDDNASWIKIKGWKY